jgi:hypothetical protein
MALRWPQAQATNDSIDLPVHQRSPSDESANSSWPGLGGA